MAGWGLVLWAPLDSGLTSGELVPVYFKSNITKTWVVGQLKGKKKVELELWRLEVYPSRKKAEARAKEYESMATLSGICLRDGLLLHEKPENNATQTYRLMIGQEIKLLAPAQGIPVKTGDEVLEGSWYLAIAEDGTQGYVFSNQLTIWDTRTAERPKLAESAPAPDARLPDLFEQTWRPEYFRSMETAKRYDFYQYQLRFGLFADPTKKSVRVEQPGFSKVYKYESINQDSEGAFVLGSSGAKIHFTLSGDLVLTPPPADISPEFRKYLLGTKGITEPAAPSAASGASGASGTSGTPEVPLTLNFIRQKNDPRALIASEERRRLNVLAALVASGERFENEQAGVLIITATTRATWVSYEQLVPAIIPEGAGDKASISMNLYVSPEMSSQWQGGFTVTFDAEKRPEVYFLYRADETSLSLLPVGRDVIKNNEIQSAGQSEPIVFTRFR